MRIIIQDAGPGEREELAALLEQFFPGTELAPATPGPDSLRREYEQTLQQLRASEERHRIVSELISDYAYALRVASDGTYTAEWETRAYEHVSGYTAEELRQFGGRRGLIHPDDLPAARRHLERLYAGEQDVSEFRIRTKSGVLRWLRNFGRPVWDEQEGRVVRIYGAAQDVTERKQAENELRESEERYRLLATHATDLITRHAPDALCLYASPSAQALLGYGPDELVGRPAFSFVHPDDLAQAREAHLRLLGEEGPVSSTLRFTRKDGRHVWLEITSRGVRDVPGGPVRELVSVSRDVTERKRLEDQFRQSQKMEAVGRLAGGIAHDFNNLLTAILGYCDVLLGDLQPADPMREGLEEILKAGERAAGLTRQLLAFSRNQVLQLRLLDLGAVVTDMDRMLRRVIGEHIELVTLLSAPEGRVRADRGQLEQVLLNLAVNARDAMPDGGKLIISTDLVALDAEYVRTHPSVRPGAYVRLAVSDTGSGMTEEIRSHLFEPFFTTKPPGRGTGLGLAMVYGVVKQSNGHVEVYSEVGHGTTFRVYLPVVEGAAEEVPVPRIGTQAPSGTETILFVEDEDVVRSLGRLVLKMHGYTVLEARNGGEALLFCEQYHGPIHLALTDVVMPHMSGPELARRLRGLRPEVKVLYMSGYTDDAVFHQGVVAEGTPFLQKPFTPDLLARKVRDVLDGKRE